jgi:hypothetical protein
MRDRPEILKIPGQDRKSNEQEAKGAARTAMNQPA